MSNVSIIIPSYNHEKFIPKAVESVLTQSHRSLELIVVDDGSKDRSLDYLRSVRDSRYRLIEQPNGGAHSAINRGLSLAQGEYLAILNSDDIFNPERLSVCLQRLNAGADLVSTWIEVIDQKGKVLGVKEGWRNMAPWPMAPVEGSERCNNPFLLNLLQSNFVSTTSNVVFSRKIYNDIGGMRNLRFAHDWDFLLRAAQQFQCELIERPLLQYRLHSNNTISSNRLWMLFEICWIYAVHLDSALKHLQEALPKASGLDELGFCGRCINLQGNDKLFWLLKRFLKRGKGNSDVAPEIQLLDDGALRQRFIDFAVG